MIQLVSQILERALSMGSEFQPVCLFVIEKLARSRNVALQLLNGTKRLVHSYLQGKWVADIPPLHITKPFNKAASSTDTIPSLQEFKNHVKQIKLFLRHHQPALFTKVSSILDELANVQVRMDKRY